MTKITAGVMCLVMAEALAVSASAETTTSHAVGAECTGGGQLCNNVATITITTTGLLQSDFTAGPYHCSSVRIHYLVDETEVAVTGFVGASVNTGVVNLGPVSAGTHSLGLQAEGQEGGCNSGFVGSWAGTAQVTVNPPQAPSLNYQGIWWNAPAESESGWGINFAHQGDMIFAAWYTYDSNGRPWWLTMLAAKTGPNTYTGKLYEHRGPALNAQPFNTGLVQDFEVGDGTLTFTDGEHGTFRYTVNGITQTKSLVRLVFGPMPTCRWGALSDLSLATNYQDMWWASPPPGVESGWGVTLTHQGDIIFVAWFTYGLDGKPLWLKAIVRKIAQGVYTGEIGRTTGPAFSAVPWDKNTVH